MDLIRSKYGAGIALISSLILHKYTNNRWKGFNWETTAKRTWHNGKFHETCKKLLQISQTNIKLIDIMIVEGNSGDFSSDEF